MNTKEEYLVSYIDYLKFRNYSDQTIKSYKRLIVDFMNYNLTEDTKGLNFSEYTRQYLLSLHERGLSWSSISLSYSAIRIFREKVLKQEWDIDHLPRPKQHKQIPRILSGAEITQLIQSPRSLKHRVIIVFLYATGLRISEVLNFKLGDIDSDRMELFVRQGKGRKDRLVSIAPRLLDVLRIYYKKYQPKEYLFEGVSPGARYSASSINKILKRARSQCKINKPISAHTLRHCYATHHLEHGTDVVYLKDQLGHRNLMTTSKYIHLCRDRMRHINHPIEELKIDIRKRII